MRGTKLKFINYLTLTMTAPFVILKKVSLKKSKISWQNLLGSFATKYLDLLKLASMLDSKFPDSILDFDIILYQYYQ